ncbi:hypothetical protein BDN72DRAFT_929685 [Pluteus cervinus]|uniref:Uncharacterized protein n=1 Tax=Pluteus cervinus TaxID=181527 RepID=A0ACD3AB08_9AGAR|nr:hypothetical protein BDN72DRAFT_929685 [Pluteus cervinus]
MSPSNNLSGQEEDTNGRPQSLPLIWRRKETRQGSMLFHETTGDNPYEAHGQYNPTSTTEASVNGDLFDGSFVPLVPTRGHFYAAYPTSPGSQSRLPLGFGAVPLDDGNPVYVSRGPKMIVTAVGGYPDANTPGNIENDEDEDSDSDTESLWSVTSLWEGCYATQGGHIDGIEGEEHGSREEHDDESSSRDPSEVTWAATSMTPQTQVSNESSKGNTSLVSEPGSPLTPLDIGEEEFTDNAVESRGEKRKRENDDEGRLTSVKFKLDESVRTANRRKLRFNYRW